MKCLAVILLIAVFSAAGGASNTWHSGLFRVNTDISSGDESIERVAEKAHAAGMKFVVYSDQFIVIAEYGLPPFRNIIRFRKKRDSVVSYGVNEYLKEIERVQKKYPDIVLIPGTDIAPHYYWTGNYFKRNLTTNKWSEQLTVFGNRDPEFYSGLPVAMNYRWGFSFWSSLKLLPLLLTFIGITALVSGRKSTYYSDVQGHSYYRYKKVRCLLLLAISAAGILWAFDNKPFTAGSPFSIYRNAGAAPFQNVIDYIRKNGGPETGVIWSAPEAEMKDKIDGVFLHTAPYLDDIEATRGYNGFAGIYGDAAHAHEPGKTWDKLLLEYCSGERTEKPVIVGESDYHGRTPVEMFQTVIHSDKTDFKSIVNAIIQGHSYATVESRGKAIFIDSVSLSNKNDSVGLGEELEIPENGKISLEIKGHFKSKDSNVPVKGTIILVQNGKLICNETIDIRKFSFRKDMALTDKALRKQYIRFYIYGGNVWMLANPIFIKTRR